ncbi:MAG TPA: hypothetical protein ENN39_05855 [Desulfonatronum sp.]|nr:hypothetical protein [Desulfonatronum sp.]
MMRFRITLNEIYPQIWRMINVPDTYSFWDLHIAIQDFMGWLDYHLHLFNPSPKHGRIKSKVGISDAEFDDGTVAGWEDERREK